MPSVIVLGAGRVGAAIARDLARDATLDVTAADANSDALDAVADRAASAGSRLSTLRVDLSDGDALGRAVDGHDLAIGAVPGPMGFATVRHVLAADVPIVDISFFEEDALELDELARSRGLVAIVDAGVAPGLSNLVLGDAEHRLRRTTRFECLVGGIPADPAPPWEYRAPFSPIDVIAEYTRPARLRRGGATVTLPALSELELVDFPGLGPLEAFNTDGLRTLLSTSEAPELVEKTMRWPGHADRIRLLRDTGFFETDPIPAGGGEVAPLDLTARLLFDAWRYEPGEADLTVMRITIDGEDDDGPVRHTFHLIDRYDPTTETSSMARTTGYTATAIARFVLAGHYEEPGVAAPEALGAAGGLSWVVDHLTDRGIEVAMEDERTVAADASRPGV